MSSLKPINSQVVIVMGASSGIGRATAIRLASKGAKLVVAARSESGLKSLVEEIQSKGGIATSVVCDVSVREQVENVVSTALSKYGRIDTWVNCSGVFMWSKFEDATEKEFRRIMDVNFMGVANALWTMIPIMKKSGGSIVVVSSVGSKMPLPYASSYIASKHALEGLLNTLRIELESEKAPINLVNIRPATIKSSLFQKCRQVKMGPNLWVGPPPYYHPDVVAECIEYAATNKSTYIYAGTMAWVLDYINSITTWGMDKLQLLTIASGIMKHDEEKDHVDNLFSPPEGYSYIEGRFKGEAVKFSVYNSIQRVPSMIVSCFSSLLGFSKK